MQIPQVFPKHFSEAVGELLSHNVVQLIINISGYDIIYNFNFPVVETYFYLYTMKCTYGYMKPVTLIKQLMYTSVT